MTKHVSGTTPLPIKELIQEAGIDYMSDGYMEEVSILGFDPMSGIGFDMKKGLLKVAKGDAIDEFGKKDLGLKEGDLLKVWDGQDIQLANVQTVLSSYAVKAKEGYELKITVLREKALTRKELKKRNKLIKKGKTVDDLPLEEVELAGKLRKVRVKQRHALIIKEDATEQQMKIRKAWLGEYILEKDMELKKD